MQRDVQVLALAIKLEVERGSVWLEDQPWGLAIGVAEAVLLRGVCFSNSKLLTDLERANGRDLRSVPHAVAQRVAVVLIEERVISIIKLAVVVQLLSRVVLMNLDAVTFDIIGVVLGAPNTTIFRVFSDTDGVTKTPAKRSSRFVVLTSLARIKDADLRFASIDIDSTKVNVLIATSRYEELVVGLSREEKGSRNSIVRSHTADDDFSLAIDGPGIGVVLILENRLRA